MIKYADTKLMKIIIELIDNKINEVKSNGFEPKFIVLSKKAYASLVARMIETQNCYEGGSDGNFPTVILGLPIVMAGDTPLDVRVLSDARYEFKYDVRV